MRQPVTIPGSVFDPPVDFEESGKHFSFYREHFQFGDFPAYKAIDGSIRFWYAKTGEMLTGLELADYLVANWVQQSEAGIRQAVDNYPELRSLKA